MWGSQGSVHAGAQVVTLEACAKQAGAALACAYSNSAEYDAALIAAQREAGVYGPKRQRRQLVAATSIATGLATALAIALFFIV